MSNFPKSQRLCGQLRIKELYTTGTKFTVWPLRVTYCPAADTQVLVWAPKSLFKHAVDRNHIRRQMREAWRLNAQELISGETNYRIAINYIDGKKQPYSVISKAINKTVKRIIESDTK